MKQFNSRAVFPILTLLVGAVWFFLGITQYGYWSEGRAMSGFFPTIIGGGLILMSVFAFLAELKAEKPSFILAYLHPVAAALGMVLLAMLIGFFASLALYIFCWLKWYEKYNLRLSLFTSVATTAAMYGIFGMWLKVPFPAGILFGWI